MSCLEKLSNQKDVHEIQSRYAENINSSSIKYQTTSIASSQLSVSSSSSSSSEKEMSVHLLLHFTSTISCFTYVNKQKWKSTGGGGSSRKRRMILKWTDRDNCIRSKTWLEISLVIIICFPYVSNVEQERYFPWYSDIRLVFAFKHIFFPKEYESINSPKKVRKEYSMTLQTQWRRSKIIIN